MNTASSSGSRTLPSNTVTNSKEDLKGITTRSGIAYKGPTIPTTSSPPKVVEHEIEVTKDMVPLTNNGSTKDVQPPIVQVETQIPNSEPVFAPVVEPVEAPEILSKDQKSFIDVYEGELTLREFSRSSQFLRCDREWQSHSLFTPFEESDFLLKEVDAFLALEDDPTSSRVDYSYYDTEGDILLLEALLNDDPSLPPVGKFKSHIRRRQFGKGKLVPHY
nr:reverse transcriptase domain-containing protein [Tanacetum cinerariifolium]